MAAIKVNTNIREVTDRLRQKLEKLKDKEYLLRPVAFDIIDLMTKRIHNEGKAADGQLIGTYSPAYMRIRTNKYKRKPDTNVIVSLTSLLENDWNVIATQKGYGVGFLNPLNFDKAGWVEERFDKNIFGLSQAERDHVTVRLTELVQEALSS